MNKLMKAAVAAALLAAPLPTAIHIAQTAKAQGEEKTVAKVNGKAITEADMQLAEAEIGNELGSIPAEARRRVVLEYVIENQLFADAAEAAKLGSGAAFEERMNYWRRRALREYYFEAELKNSVSDDEAKKFYDQQVGSAKAQEEVRARHILVDNEDLAKELQGRSARVRTSSRSPRSTRRTPAARTTAATSATSARGRWCRYSRRPPLP